MRGAIFLRILKKFWLGRRITSVSYWMYRGQVVLGRLKFTQQSHLCQSLVPLRFRSLSESWKGIRHQVLIRFQQKILAGGGTLHSDVRFQVLTAASMMFRIVFWDVLPCKIILDRYFRGAYLLHHQGWVMMEAVRSFETSVDNYFTRQYILEDSSEHYCILRYINLLHWSGTKKNCLTSGKSQLYLFTKRMMKLTAVNIEANHCCQLHTKFYLTFFL
jgi:hypothetical protein